MKNQITKIWIIAGILLLSISTLAMFIPNAVAQDASSITVNAEVQDGCDWTGTPYLATSNLDVWDDEICIIRGTGKEAFNVYVHQDGDIKAGGGSTGGQAGGWLIIGSETENTDFKMHGNQIYFNGIVDVGNTLGAAHTNTATLRVDLTDVTQVQIAGGQHDDVLLTPGSDGILTVQPDTNTGTNQVIFNSTSPTITDLRIGSQASSTAGEFIQNSSGASSEIDRVTIEDGDFSNLDGTITVEDRFEIQSGGTGAFDNDDLITITDGGFRIQGAVTGDNSGTMTFPADRFTMGDTSYTTNFTNSGTMTQTLGGDWFNIGYGTFNNTSTGIINSDMLIVGDDATFNNDGDVNILAGLGLLVTFDDGADATVATFNNKNGGTVDAKRLWTANNGATTANKSIFNNLNGGAVTTERLEVGIEDGGFADFGITFVQGAIFNNSGDLIVTAANGAGVFRGGQLNNELTGTIDVQAGPLQIGTTNTNNNCLTATTTDGCRFTNDNNTTANAVDVTGNVLLEDYAIVDNAGNLTVAGADNIVVGTENTTSETTNIVLTNQANGDIELNGATQVFLDEDLNFDNDGAFEATATSITMDDDINFDNTGTFTVSNTGSDLTLNTNAISTNSGTINIADDFTLNDNTSITQTTSGAIDLTSIGGIMTLNNSSWVDIQGGTVDIDSTSSGYLYIYTDHATGYTNAGTTSTRYLRNGVIPTTQGGALINTGTFNVLDTSTNAVHVYKGTVTNNSATLFDSDGRIQVRGDASVAASFQSDSAVNSEGMYIWEYGTIDINGGTWSNGENLIYLWGGTVDGVLDIASGGILDDINFMYMGDWNDPGGDLINAGTIHDTVTDDDFYIAITNGGSVVNSGTIDMGNAGYFEMGAYDDDYLGTGPILVDNNIGGSIIGDTFRSCNDAQVITNLGTITMDNDIYIGGYSGGNCSGSDGGNFYNGNISGTTPGTINLTDDLYVRDFGDFYNYKDSNLSMNNLNGAITIGGSGGDAHFYQEEGSTSGIKINPSAITINTGGYLYNDDEIDIEAALSVNSGGTYEGQLAASNTIDSILTSGATSYLNGTVTLEGDATDHSYWYVDNLTLISTTGILSNNGTVNVTSPGTANNLRNAGGKIKSGVNSVFTFLGTPGYEQSAGGFAEFAGTTNVSNMAVAGGQTTINIDYNTQTANFTIGESITGTGGGTGTILDDTDNGTNGTLTIQILTDFYNGDTLTGSGGGSATASADPVTIADICFGEFTGNTCTHSSTDPLVEFTTAAGSGGDSIFDIDNVNVDIYNDMTFSDGDAGDQDYLYAFNGSTIIQGNNAFMDFQDDTNLWIKNSGSSFTSNGNMDIQGTGTGSHGYLRVTEGGDVNLNGTTYNIGSIAMYGGTGGGEASVNISATTTVNLNDTHNELTLTNPTITTGVQNLSGSEDIYIYGTVNLNGGIEQNLYLGTDSPSNWNVDGVIVFDGGSLQHTNGSTGTLDINQTGVLYVGDDGTAAKDMDINGPTIVGGNYGHDQNGPHGAYISGDFETETSLIIENDGLLDVALTGDVVVAGSTTTVNGLIELDGTLTPGDLTVASGGIISSGDGAEPLSAPTWPTYQGCGPNGVFGCGTTTNFYINADSLNVALGGKISSDGVSTADRDNITIAHGGSYGGEGVANGTPDTTYGAVKASSPTYGDQGEKASDAFSGHGGGGVEIYVDGDILINGTVSANAGTVTYDINYGTQTANFTTGAVLTGGISGAQASIIADNDGGTTGTLTLNMISGIFQNAETITDNAGGSATTTSGPTANSATGAAGTVIITHAPLTTADTFEGNGTIQANGLQSDANQSYPGGGGRIVIDAILLDDPDDDCSATHPHYLFTGSVEAYGGDDGSSTYSAAGTIVYLGDANNPNDTLIVNQGGNAPTATTETQIPATGDYVFDRVEARDAAVITYATNPATNPVACFDNDTGSTVTGPTCTAAPDKPDTMNLDDAVAGAQAGCGTSEPSFVNPVTGLYGNPVFSFIYRNPESTATVDSIRIQVDDNSDFSTPLWDSTLTSVTQDNGNPINPGFRTEDIAYAGPALSASTPYYVRAAFIDGAAQQGLWTHLDINNYYQFEVDGSMTITDGCTASMQLLDGANNPKTANGKRYATDSCTFTAVTDSTAWQILFGLDPSNSAFENAGATANIDPIDNAGADCNITTDGTGSEEEYGYNISNLTGVLSIAANDSECSQAYNNWTVGTGNYVFDIEGAGSEDSVATATATTAGSSFDVNIHSTVNPTTAADDYSVDVRAIITTNP